MQRFRLAAVFLVTASTATVNAQIATTTSLVGNVTDSSGKSIPNAKVTAVETGTLATSTTSTNEQGFYYCGRGHLVGCIDATAFTIADLYPAVQNFAYGSAGRNILRGPGAEEVTFSVAKTFPIKERVRFQFRFETFGLFNHTNFANPSAVINTSSFGSIVSATGTRNIQLGGKLNF